MPNDGPKFSTGREPANAAHTLGCMSSLLSRIQVCPANEPSSFPAACMQAASIAVCVGTRAVRRRHCVGGGAPVNFGRRGRRAAGPKKSAAAAAERGGVGGQKQFFLRYTNKFRSILKIFLGTFLVIKALRFADDQC